MRKFCAVIFFVTVMLSCVSWLNSCSSGTSEGHLSVSKMEDILYDCHVAVGMLRAESQGPSNDGYQSELYKLAILRKYGVTEQQFDASMAYYMRHADELQEIYKSVAERLKDEAAKIGVTVADNGGSSLSGDTTNVWPLDASLVLYQKPPCNKFSFTVKADTSFHKGDRICLTFQSSYLFPEGFKDGQAMLYIRYANDSIAERSTHFSSNSVYRLEIDDNEKIGIKEMGGFLYLNKDMEEQPSPLNKVLVISDMQLLRIHQKETAPVTVDGNGQPESPKE